MVLAATISVSGIHGVLVLIAAILFLIGALVAWFVAPRMLWAAVVAAGLCLWSFATLIH